MAQGCQLEGADGREKARPTGSVMNYAKQTYALYAASTTTAASSWSENSHQAARRERDFRIGRETECISERDFDKALAQLVASEKKPPRQLPPLWRLS